MAAPNPKKNTILKRALLRPVAPPPLLYLDDFADPSLPPLGTLGRFLDEWLAASCGVATTLLLDLIRPGCGAAPCDLSEVILGTCEF